jgi:hypothetical protein
MSKIILGSESENMGCLQFFLQLSDKIVVAYEYGEPRQKSCVCAFGFYIQP